MRHAGKMDNNRERWGLRQTGAHRPAQLAAAPPLLQTADGGVTSPPTLAILASLGLSPRHSTGLRGKDKAPRSNTLGDICCCFLLCGTQTFSALLDIGPGPLITPRWAPSPETQEAQAAFLP